MGYYLKASYDHFLPYFFKLIIYKNIPYATTQIKHLTETEREKQQLLKELWFITWIKTENLKFPTGCFLCSSYDRNKYSCFSKQS
jgi:hypothetical protein